MSMKSSAAALLCAGMAALAAGSARAQASFSENPEAQGISQPHLLAARRLAEQDNGWISPMLTACYTEGGSLLQRVEKNPPPTQVADNLYFLGTGQVSAWAVKTSAGVILIDTLNNQAEAQTFIVGGLRALGLDPAQIKDIVISHAHADHFGGAAYLQKTYGAKVYMSAADWAYLPAWLKGPYARGRTIEVPRQDGALQDGDTLTLGDTTIKVLLTPGHTPGALSLLVPVADKGQPHIFVFEGGVSSENHLTPALHETYDRAIGRLAAAAQAARADGYFANHGNFDGMAFKIAALRAQPNGPNPFIVGSAAVQRWLAIAKECNLNNRDIDAAMAARTAKAGG